MLPSERRLLVLDDDPTGSQCVHDISVAFEQNPELLAGTLSTPGSACFTLTNSRALDEVDAVELNRATVRGVIQRLREESGEDAVRQLHVISRSDSTLRGHVIAEPTVIADTLSEEGFPVDAVLFSPAMLEAGRYTQDDVHFAIVDGQAVPVSDTDFANDATFGYSSSDLKEFLQERSNGSIAAEDVLSISLKEIRDEGASHVESLLADARNRRWVVINAETYEDMQVVADAVTALEKQGHRFITRCGPSFVRPLAGQSDPRILDSADIATDPERLQHGLVVVGSHVGLTTQQLHVLQERGRLVEYELDVRQLLDPETRMRHLDETTARLRRSLQTDDVALYTSRELISASDPAESLAIARSVSEAVVEVVARVRDARPAWVIAKGGITSHEVAQKGLGIRLARVVGQFFPGQISLFEPVEAADSALGCPYVVFPGNVGGREALAEVAERLKGATTDEGLGVRA